MSTSTSVKGVTSSDRAVFTNGECHSLAVALHRERGWPLAVAGFHIGGEHAFVIVASGFALDVNGVRPTDEIKEEWGGRIRRVSEAYFSRNGWSTPKITPRVERVRDKLLAALIEDAKERA